MMEHLRIGDNLFTALFPTLLVGVVLLGMAHADHTPWPSHWAWVVWFGLPCLLSQLPLFFRTSHTGANWKDFPRPFFSVLIFTFLGLGIRDLHDGWEVFWIIFGVLVAGVASGVGVMVSEVLRGIRNSRLSQKTKP